MAANPQNLGSQSRVSKGNFKGLEGDIGSISKNALNSSTSKMQYSFPKSQRFNPTERSYSPAVFYQPFENKSKRTTSFGYGNKLDLGKQTVKTPPPNTYSLKSDFEGNKTHGITMGAGRQVVRANSPFSLNTAKNPGPGNYEPKPYFSSHSFSMKPRLEDNTDKWIRSVPGPGNYPYLQLLNKQTRSPVSKYESCPSTRFGKVERKGLGAANSLKVPGVGNYEIEKQDYKTSKYCLRAGSRFSNSKRKGPNDTTLVTPGPGSYHRFSEFLH